MTAAATAPRPAAHPGRQRTWRAPLSPSDTFHDLVDAMIRRGGGPGNVGQLRLRCTPGTAIDTAALDAAWRAAGQRLWPLGATVSRALFGARWVARGPVRLALETAAGGLDALASAHLRSGLDGALMRLAVATGDQPGAVLTWSHRLCDARGAMGLVAALADPAALAGEDWRAVDYRQAVELPSGAADRGRLARGCIDLLHDHRQPDPLRLGGPGLAPAAPIAVHHLALGAADTARCDARQRAATGRLSETPFLVAAVAAAIERVAGDQRSDGVLIPLAVDQRPPGEARMLANCHSFLFLGLTSGLATLDLGAAARQLKDGQRRWLAADGAGKMTAALSWFGLFGERFGQAQLGFMRAGLAASCLVANTGRTLVPERWFGATIAGVDHATTVPGQPGVAVLFHRDSRGLGFDVIVVGRVLRRLDPAHFAALVREQLLDRPFPGAPA